MNTTNVTRVTYRGVQLDRMARGKQILWAPARQDHTWTIWQHRAADVLRPGGDSCYSTGIDGVAG